jgi:hypothetical protein
LIRTSDDLIVHIGVVADVNHRLLSVKVAEHPKKKVKDDAGSGVTKVRIVINRGSANIKSYPLGILRGEGHFPLGKGIVQDESGVHLMLLVQASIRALRIASGIQRKIFFRSGPWGSPVRIKRRGW